jgi:hypothetical protein
MHKRLRKLLRNNADKNGVEDFGFEKPYYCFPGSSRGVTTGVNPVRVSSTSGAALNSMVT